MIMRKQLRDIGTLAAITVLAASSCKHEPWVPDNFNPSPDDTVTTSPTCDPDTVYFVNDVLPIFQSSCAISGCHNAPNGQDGVILTDYQHILSTGDIHPGDPNDSKICDVLFETGSDQMPPVSSGITLTDDQKNAIYTWILQGAANNSCIENTCDSVGVSFATDVKANIIDVHCISCHGGSATAGNGVQMNNHAQIAALAATGELLGTVDHEAGYPAMPLGGAKLSDCKIAIIRNWISEGSQNN